MSDELRGLALRLLARREHSRAELRQKLAAHGSAEDVDAILDHMEQCGLLSDARFAEAYIASRRNRLGTFRLRRELRDRGVADALIVQALDQSGGDELARAREVWRRKFGVPPADVRDYARQARFLQSRGFAGDVLKQILREIEE